MASADEYANWIVNNADKKGTPEFDTVAKAYELAKAESPNHGAQPYDHSTLTKRAMALGQGLTFGFGDELAGMVPGVDKDRYRATLDQYAKDEPIGSGVSNFIGGSIGPAVVAVPKLLKKVAPVLGLMDRSPVLTAGGTGLLYGGLQSAGDSDGQGIGGDALKGGGIGAGLGLAMMGSMKAVSPIAGALVNNVRANMPGIGDKYAIDLARRRVASAFDRDNVTVADVGRRMKALGGEARFADAAGENTRGTLDLNANLPGRTKEDLEQLIRNRQATRPGRMDDVVYSVNGGYGRARDINTSLEAQKVAESAPLYQQLHSMSIPVSDNLRSIFDSAKRLGAAGTASKIATAERVPFSLGNKEANDALMNVSRGGNVSMRDADLIKRGIDDLIEGQTDPITQKVTTLGRSYVRLKNDLLSELDTLTTDPKTGVSLYKSARDAFAGPASLQSAIKKGRAFWNDDAEKIATLTEGFSQSEHEAFKIGASEKLREMVGTQSGQNRLLNVWKDRNTREKFQALLGDDVKYSQVEQMLKGEETLKRLESLGPGRNSRTFSREAASDQQNADNASDLISAGMSVKTGGLSSLLSAASKYATRAATPEPVRNGIGSILMSKYSTDEMKALELAMKAIKDRQRAAAVATGATGGKLGGGLLGD